MHIIDMTSIYICKLPQLKTILYLLLLLFVKISFADSHYNFSKLTLSDGLPSAIVRVIIQDKIGFMWFGTRHGVVKFDGYQLKQVNDDEGQSLGDIWSILETNDGSLLIASKTRGLFKYQSGSITYLNIFDNRADIELTSLGLDKNNILWLGTNEGVYKLIDDKPLSIRKFNHDNSYDFLNLNKKHILGQTKKTVYQYDIENNKQKRIKILPIDNKLNSTLYADSYGEIWLGRKNGLYAYDKLCQCFKNHFDELKDINIYSLVSDQRYLWIGTVYNGLYRYSYESSKLVKISLEDTDNESLGKTIVSLYIDNSAVLWVGTFNAGIYYLNPTVLQFDSISAKNKSVSCVKNFTIHDVLESRDKSLWLATESGVVRVNKNNDCTVFEQQVNENSLTANPILNLYQTVNDDIWILNSKQGFDKLSSTSGEIERAGGSFAKNSFFFSVEYNKNELLLGSFQNGLFVYDIVEKNLTPVENTNNKFDKATFFTYAINNKQIYFGTNKGLVRLVNNKLEELTLDGREISEISSMKFDHKGALWLSINFKTLLKRNKDGIIEDITTYLKNNNTPIQIRSMVLTDETTLWLSSNNGIYKLDTESYENWHFTAQDGLQDADFFRNSYHQNTAEGKIYFGGQKGVNSFYPDEITINQIAPDTIITSLMYFNKILDVGTLTESGFKLDKPINYLNQIELGYKDYIIGFGFAALDYADSKRNQYAYRLKGLNDDWIYVDANDRKVTYTNLQSGAYTFQVKAANKDGIWNEKPTELKIKVYPAPWLSSWAYFAYIIMIMVSIWAFIRYKTIASRKRAETLEATVVERTQEVSRQKKMVESLLDHKNEVFANVTHEFKTPLALILGPAEQLSQNSQSDEDKNSLKMIQRNAKRLILMVGQILKLSEAELNKEVLRESQAVKPILTMLYESFKPLANDKNIKIHLVNQQDVNVYATADCLEIVIGNLLSNALKFTHTGGEITISSQLKDKQISISVRDTGTGIEAKDISKIFKRFTRLDTHKSIQGTGIGLSVVKEITEANNGEVKLHSEWGKGSEFTVIFPITEIEANQELSQIMVDQLVGNTKNEITDNSDKATDNSKQDNNRVTVLIIEDNLDMQSHIDNVLKQRFNCLFADRGKKGIALALQEIPDIIICDVMMPGMDGYQVTRIIRHDSRTSHIPIILLTALNTKESRIKGWRENIDTYITKPFDAIELNVQLDNILTIRSILQKKTNKAIKHNTALSSLDLPLQDQKFIEKFKNVIGEYYDNEYFQIADIASKMAVSERQLQRKVRALIDKTPMDLLRDYRLEKAALKLKDGYQVGRVSVECGFSSFSYFSSCFKKKYGMTAKKYQMLDKKK
jgi:signal transduction histidine kinase/ligand-binding sensor domain-containing protein/CheY-like chemotaxis protein